MIHHSHLNTAVRILDSYRGGQPFALFIREFFKADKKYGSRDRKQISRLCYAFFRLGLLAGDRDTKDRILLGIFLGTAEEEVFPDGLQPGWSGAFGLPFADKCLLAGISYSAEAHFPMVGQLTGQIDQPVFTRSHFIQPDLFIRIRPGKKESLYAKLSAAGIGFREIPPSALAFPNSTNIEQVIIADTDAVIQDYSSQGVAGFFPDTGGRKLKVWDSCAASGGKSILFLDHAGQADLTVSDLRQNILYNLQQRFERAGIRDYRSLVVDLGTSAALSKGLRAFDFIIADVPCSGSGTWGRTPEHLRFFTPEKLEHYTLLQKKIVGNSLPALSPGGHYLYITCSVFRAENEEAVEYISSQGLQPVRSGYIKGYGEKADTLFAALFRKPD
ncbi:MAG: Fmu (Sun) domain-containing protein [Chitinophagaceae bacterium]|nr:MAG: Fmu (Sun) domain-containing protein [Chitinophagaceae bacterium]